MTAFGFFWEISELDVKKIVLKGEATICVTKPLTSKLMEKHLDTLLPLPLLARMVNISLVSVTFADD